MAGQTSPKQDPSIDELLGVVQGARNVLIVTHTDPDPDAIGSAVGLGELLRKRLGVEVVLSHSGIVGRAENKAMVRELAIPLRPYCQVRCDEYDIVALVDSQPGAGNQPLTLDCRVDIVIDHHPRRPETDSARFTAVRQDYAASSTIVTRLMRAARVRPSPQAATALFYGIRTDTLGLSRPSTEYDSRAYVYLLKYVDRDALLRIENASVPADYFRALDGALHQTTHYDGLVVAQLGNMRYPDMAAEVADFLRRLEGAEVIVAVGDYAGEVVVSVRGTAQGLKLDELVQQVIGSDGTAGGHDSMAAGRVPALLYGSPEETAAAIVARFAKALNIQHYKPIPLVP
ncbi:MAG: DHH family phosphoesterase [Anaerolineae bacterium]